MWTISARHMENLHHQLRTTPTLLPLSARHSTRQPAESRSIQFTLLGPFSLHFRHNAVTESKQVKDDFGMPCRPFFLIISKFRQKIRFLVLLFIFFGKILYWPSLRIFEHFSADFRRFIEGVNVFYFKGQSLR